MIQAFSMLFTTKSPPLIRANHFKMNFSFRYLDESLAEFNQDVVISFKQKAHNEYKMVLALDEETGERLLVLNQREKLICINSLTLFTPDSQISIPLLVEQLVAVENAKISPLNSGGVLSPAVTLTLHLFNYGGVDYDKLTNQ